jgi:hypothetical protein
VASIEERLDREDWDPVPGDRLIGTITGITVRTSKKGDPYPVLYIKDGEGNEHTVSGALMASDIIVHQPQPGERVGVKFCGPQQKSDGSGDTWDKYAIEFEDDKAVQVDWAAMAQARGVAIKDTGNGAAAADNVTAANPTAEDPRLAEDVEPSF